MTTRRVELLRDLDRDTGWVLLVDGVEQSYVDVADAGHLEFEYMQHMALAIDAWFPRDEPLRALHLGGGALTMPRWLVHTRPGSVQTVIDSSPEVLAEGARLGPVPACEIVVDDAMAAVAAVPAGSVDLVVWDLYDGPRADVSALTAEAVGSMRRALGAGGQLVLNVSDVLPFDVVRPVLAAMLPELDDVALLAEPATLRGRRSGNCVLVGVVARPLPVDLLARRAAGAPVRARLVAGADLVTFVGAARAATAADPLPQPDPRSGRGFL